MRRRSLLAGLAAAPVLGAATQAMTPTPATADPAYATVICGPHADDWFLRLAPYAIWATDRGDSIAAITATDGAATGVATRLGLTYAEITEWRAREDQHAWDWLTNGRGGQVTNLGLPDGSATTQQIYTAISTTLAGMTGKPEAYLAVYDPAGTHAYVPNPKGGDDHPDHIAMLHAGRMLAADGITVRYAVHPSRVHRTNGTMAYRISGKQFSRMEAAAAAYRTIGQRSVPASFRHALDARKTVVVR